MKGYAVLFFIFGILIILMGIYIYTGHDDLLIRGYYKKRSKAYLKYLGKVVIIVGFCPIISAISALIIKEDSFIPFLILIVSVILSFVFSVKYLKGGE